MIYHTLNLLAMTFTSIFLFSLLITRPLGVIGAVVPRAPDSTNATTTTNIASSDLPPAIWEVCEGGVNATTVISQSINAGGVKFSRGYCNPQMRAGANATTSTTSIPGQALRTMTTSPSISMATGYATTRAVMARQSCPGAANNCVQRFGSTLQGRGYVNKCGAQCNSSCYPGSNGPNPNDCQHIFDSFNRNNPQLFALQPNQYLLATYGTCGTAIQNQIAASSIGCSQWMVYDYQDWAAVGNYLAWNCQAQQGARGGRCTGTTGIYQPRIPDFYIQVYQNA